MFTRHSLFVTLFSIFLLPGGVHSIGVNYGTMGNDLPPPAEVARFVKENTTIDRIKIFDVNPDILRAFANTEILVTVTVPDGEIPRLASNSVYARQWVAEKIKPFYPATKINIISVGSEVIHWGTTEMKKGLVPAMRRLYLALIYTGIKDIKVSSAHSLGIMNASSSDLSPSQAQFRNEWDVTGILSPMLNFLNQTKGPFLVNPYPYFGYNRKSADLALFRPNKGVFDRHTNKTYYNMFDMLLDSVFAAMCRLGYPDVEIVAAETGWPSAGEEFEPQCTVANARSYNAGLMRRNRNGIGTPLMPRSRTETYIFALFNENLKTGSKAERNFGLFRPDFSPVYSIGIMKGETDPSLTPAHPQPWRRSKFCVPKRSANIEQLIQNINYACAHVDCRPIQPGGACFRPTTARAHAAYAMNTFYQTKGRKPFQCNFTNTARFTHADPSAHCIK